MRGRTRRPDFALARETQNGGGGIRTLGTVSGPPAFKMNGRVAVLGSAYGFAAMLACCGPVDGPVSERGVARRRAVGIGLSLVLEPTTVPGRGPQRPAPSNRVASIGATAPLLLSYRCRSGAGNDRAPTDARISSEASVAAARRARSVLHECRRCPSRARSRSRVDLVAWTREGRLGAAPDGSPGDHRTHGRSRGPRTTTNWEE
jgi:hypothetical protein